eukprot:TRINITY_DN1444_c4_g1_i1.p1 TRINITY_DN1444_c4_g1~~TRINITY_DN1444_c4_g1_i1.p1  ORF type:complete len:786 (+),score=134.53 TRINITY_DN1444_c4_g1_i1:63-2360(+)
MAGNQGASAPLLPGRGGPRYDIKLPIRIVVCVAAILFLACILIAIARPPFGHHGLHGEDLHRTTDPFPLASKGKFKHHYISRFLAVPRNFSAEDHLRVLTQQPHVAGTEEDREAAAYVYSQFKDFGLSKVHYSHYTVLLSYPLERSLSLLAPYNLELAIHEGKVPEDPFSSNPKVIDTFHAYSASGDVSGEVVFVNYGSADDFAKLAEMGVNASGCIALVKYGNINRGNKVENAANAGALGVLVYSDPADYAASFKEGVYPESQWLPSSGVQRGSIAAFRGDPSTPSWPATEDCERLDINDRVLLNLPSIPSLPISYGDAYPILAALEGDVAPKDWWGALNLSEYRVGKGPAAVRLNLKINSTLAPIRNVHAIIEGREEPDRYVVLGNHRDAWTFGAVDPNSGTTSLLEMARGFSVLLKAGWRPRRTIVLGNWDAEEYALIGSAEWAEENEDALVARAVAYINVDVAVGGPGPFSASATPQLDDFLREVAKMVEDPQDPPRSLYDGWIAAENTTIDKNTVAEVTRVGGAGSDYAGFISHIGVSSVDMAMGPASGYPVYHSVYDNLNWMTNFGDPGFHRLVAMAQVWGVAGILLADLPVLPHDYTSYAEELKKYLLALDAKLSEAKAEGVSTHSIHAALANFFNAAYQISREAQVLTRDVALQDRKGGVDLPTERRLRDVNDRLMLAERAFVSGDGLPGRPWYRHLIYAPAASNYYGTSPFPGIVDSIAAAEGAPSAKSWAAVQHEVFRVGRAITKAANVLRGELS